MPVLPGDLHLRIGEREGGAGMDVAELLVGLAAAVGLLGDENVAGEQAAYSRTRPAERKPCSKPSLPSWEGICTTCTFGQAAESPPLPAR